MTQHRDPKKPDWNPDDGTAGRKPPGTLEERLDHNAALEGNPAPHAQRDQQNRRPAPDGAVDSGKPDAGKV